MKINVDCKFYEGNMPCKFHKIDGRLCRNCKNYAPVKKHILIIKLKALGDVLRTTSILPAIKNKYPLSHITWVTSKEAFALLENNDFLDVALHTQTNYLEYVLQQKFDIAICLDLEPLSATINALSNASVKKGFIADKRGRIVPAGREARSWYEMSMNDAAKKKNRKSYFYHIYEISGLKPPYFKPVYNITKDEANFAQAFKSEHKLDKYSKVIGINTGANQRWQLKKWTLEHYINLIRLLKEKFSDVGILLYGGEGEAEFNSKIKSEAGDLVIDTGCNNSLREFAALVGLSDIFLTPDSLGMHVSLALDKVTFVLAGPTSPWEIDVFGKGEVIYNKKLECLSCYLPVCDKPINCMNSLKPADILGMFEKYL